jgi:hypothetical protein
VPTGAASGDDHPDRAVPGDTMQNRGTVDGEASTMALLEYTIMGESWGSRTLCRIRRRSPTGGRRTGDKSTTDLSLTAIVKDD